LLLTERNCQLRLRHSSAFAAHSEEGVVVEHQELSFLACQLDLW